MQQRRFLDGKQHGFGCHLAAKLQLKVLHTYTILEIAINQAEVYCNGMGLFVKALISDPTNQASVPIQKFEASGAPANAFVGCLRCKNWTCHPQCPDSLPQERKPERQDGFEDAEFKACEISEPKSL